MHTPVSQDWVEAISKVHGVVAKLEGIKHVVVQGEQEAVKKAVKMLYELQLVYGMKETRLKNVPEKTDIKKTRQPKKSFRKKASKTLELSWNCDETTHHFSNR